jgi:hypothetical protein
LKAIHVNTVAADKSLFGLENLGSTAPAQMATIAKEQLRHEGSSQGDKSIAISVTVARDGRNKVAAYRPD